MKSSKFQAPTSKEIRNPKHQTIITLFDERTRRRWSLKIGASLVLGGWCLVFLAVPAALGQFSID